MTEEGYKVEYCEGEMEEILRRDQRTTSHRLFVNCKNSEIDNNCQKNYDNNYVTINNERKNHFNFTEKSEVSVDELCHNWNKCKENRGKTRISRLSVDRRKLNSMLLWLVCLSWMILTVTVQSAPTNMDSHDDQRMSWLAKCGTPHGDSEFESAESEPKDGALVNAIIVNTELALDHARSFRDAFYLHTFSQQYNGSEKLTKNVHHDWLPSTKQIPKKIGQNLSEDFVKKVKLNLLNEALANTYMWFQMYGIGFEQALHDRINKDHQFYFEFRDTVTRLHAVVCEAVTAMEDRGMPKQPTVKRSIMPDSLRNESISQFDKNLRDWLTFRDYINALEYTEELFKIFEKQLDAQPSRKK